MASHYTPNLEQNPNSVSWPNWDLDSLVLSSVFPASSCTVFPLLTVFQPHWPNCSPSNTPTSFPSWPLHMPEPSSAAASGLSLAWKTPSHSSVTTDSSSGRPLLTVLLLPHNLHHWSVTSLFMFTYTLCLPHLIVISWRQRPCLFYSPVCNMY